MTGGIRRFNRTGGAVAELVGNEGAVVSGVIHPTLARRTGDHAMTSITTKPDSAQPAAEMAVDLFDSWFDPLETELRARARGFIEELIRGELDAVLARPRYGRSQVACDEGRAGVGGHRHGSQKRTRTGTFGPVEIAVPRARLDAAGRWDSCRAHAAAEYCAFDLGPQHRLDHSGGQSRCRLGADEEIDRGCPSDPRGTIIYLPER
ncbi:hypothetical protein ACVIGB_000168 [Bradyrhizobium sp. USDA 4341]